MSKPQDRETIHRQWMEAFFHGLRAYEETSFPRTCQNCGRTFQTLDEFIRETEPCGEMPSGLGEWDIGLKESLVGVFRNCTCKSTLMEHFHDRRDNSAAGQQRREAFDNVINTLIEAGMPACIARRELRKLVRGETSPLLQNFAPAVPSSTDPGGSRPANQVQHDGRNHNRPE